MQKSTSRRRTPLLTSADFWRNLTLGASVVLTTLTGLVVGWFAIYFQFFGASPTADDYRVGAGAYGASAFVLVLGAVAVWTWGAPRWEGIVAVTGAAVLALLCVEALSGVATADAGFGHNGWLDGAGGVTACPWTWPLVVLGIWGPVRGWFRRDLPAART